MYPCFPGVLFTNTPHNILEKLVIIFVLKTDIGEGEMDSVAMTIINARKEYRPSRISNQLSIRKLWKLPTELRRVGLNLINALHKANQ